MNPNTIIRKRVLFVEPKTGDVRDSTWIVANRIDFACFDRMEVFVAADRVTGCGFGPRFATEQQCRDYYETRS